MTDETTTEQLAEIGGQTEDTPATEYTPPEGWRVVRFGESLLPGDLWVNEDGTEQRSNILQWDASAVSGGLCIRRIKPQPPPEPEAEPQPIQVREGRWRTRGGDIRNVTATPEGDGRKYTFPWWDAQYRQTWTSDGRYYLNTADQRDLIEYLGPIEPQPEPQPQPNAAAIEELRSEVSYVQNLLGTERRRVTQLEELVGSLRTINEAQEKAFEAAGKENTALRNQLAAVKAELASVAADRQQLRVELDAAQQVPPAIADRFKEGWNQGTARAVETVLEWLEPVRAVDHPNLSNETLQHLPQIMRHLTGLDSHAID